MRRIILAAALLALAGNAKADDATIIKGLVWVAAASQYCGVNITYLDAEIIRHMAAKSGVGEGLFARQLGMAARNYIRTSTHEHMIHVCSVVHRMNRNN